MFCMFRRQRDGGTEAGVLTGLHLPCISDTPDVDIARTLWWRRPNSQPCRQHGKAWGTVAGRGPRQSRQVRIPLASPGGNFAVDIYLLPRREVATHPDPSSVPGARMGNCFLKENSRGTCILNSGEKLHGVAGTSQAESPLLRSGWFKM